MRYLSHFVQEPQIRPFALSIALLSVLASASLDAQTLGPADSTTLSPSDTGRVKSGMRAPDFTLASFAGPTVTLSQFRGKKTVLLAFYRGHW